MLRNKKPTLTFVFAVIRYFRQADSVARQQSENGEVFPDCEDSSRSGCIVIALEEHHRDVRRSRSVKANANYEKIRSGGDGRFEDVSQCVSVSVCRCVCVCMKSNSDPPLVDNPSIFYPLPVFLYSIMRIWCTKT